MALTAAFRQWLTGWEEFRVLPAGYYELDEERVLVIVHGSGRGRTTGLEVEQIQTKRGANLFYVSDGRVRKLALDHDRQRALADCGMGDPRG